MFHTVLDDNVYSRDEDGLIETSRPTNKDNEHSPKYWQNPRPPLHPYPAPVSARLPLFGRRPAHLNKDWTSALPIQTKGGERQIRGRAHRAQHLSTLETPPAFDAQERTGTRSDTRPPHPPERAPSRLVVQS